MAGITSQMETDPSIIMEMIDGFYSTPYNPDLVVQSDVGVLSCIDSRTQTGRIMGHNIGQAYSVRTVANIAPKIDMDLSFQDQQIEVAAALEYLVRHKRIKEMYVLGHTHCGGAEARIMQDPIVPIVNKWVHHVCPDLLPHAPSAEFLSALKDVPFFHQAALREMERACLRTSIDNIKSLPFVADALERGDLSLAGLILDMDAKRLLLDYGGTAARVAAHDALNNFEDFKNQVWGPGSAMEHLVEHGQHPKALIITGISPYVAPEMVFGLNPGDAFTHSRIGGHYHHERTPGGLAASIEFAVAVKRVSSLVIVGHRDDVNYDYANGDLDHLPILTSFLEKSTERLREWRHGGMHPDRMHERSLSSAFYNVMCHPAVRQAIEEKRLSVTALSVSHRGGENLSEYYNPSTDRFLKIQPPRN